MLRLASKTRQCKATSPLTASAGLHPIEFAVLGDLSSAGVPSGFILVLWKHVIAKGPKEEEARVAVMRVVERPPPPGQITCSSGRDAHGLGGDRTAATGCAGQARERRVESTKNTEGTTRGGKRVGQRGNFGKNDE